MTIFIRHRAVLTILSCSICIVFAPPIWSQEDAGRASPAKDAALEFKVSPLPEIPKATMPAPSFASGMPHVLPPKNMPPVKKSNLGSVDVETLGKYDEAVKFDKSEASPEEKAAKWRALGAEVNAFADIAAKRASQWDGYAPQAAFQVALDNDSGESTPEAKSAIWREIAERYPSLAQTAKNRANEWARYAKELAAMDDARKKRNELRDIDWAKLGKLLSYSVVSDEDKRKFAQEFVHAYGRVSWDNPYSAELAPYIPSGPLRFPFQIMRGMSLHDVEQIVGTNRPEKGGTRWPISGQLAYKQFRPAWFVAQIHGNMKAYSLAYQGAKGKARMDAMMAWSKDGTYDSPEHAAIRTAWSEEDNYKYGKVDFVSVWQPADNCDELQSIFPDAVEFVSHTYAATKQHETPKGDRYYARDCLGGINEYTWNGDGYWVRLEATNDLAGSGINGSASDRFVNMSNMKYIVSLTYGRNLAAVPGKTKRSAKVK